ncbi:hypothetical protein Cni_G27142 [Canna indica]|uniref:NB-ARC domain-containing protein n=1 Tax=Canna indica TaxID=4628 RepID=A0AAQ3L071_9LILI|nr:hypothetical protein Cni_G27142 [Canna indica]
MSFIVDALLKCLLADLVESATQTYKNVKDCGSKIETLQTHLHQLTKKKETIDHEVETEIKKGKEPIPQVDEWCNKVKMLESEASKLESKFHQNAGSLFAYVVNFMKLLEVSQQAKHKLDEADELKKDGDFHEVAKLPKLNHSVAMITGTFVGIDDALEQLKRYKMDDKVSVVGICGMGRVGKSTILKKFCNGFTDAEKSKQIEVDFDKNTKNKSVADYVQDIIMDTYELKEEEEEDKNSVDDRATRIRKQLEKEEFYLILDNVWEYINLYELGIPNLNVHKKGKVFLSTRSTKICKRMEAKTVRVKTLSFENAWTLFKDKVGDAVHGIEEDSRIEERARELLRKCDGLPEALIHVGHAVASKERLEEWDYIIEQLDSKPWKIENMVQVLASLKQGYDKLNTALQKCLLYCSLYPPGFPIKRKWIIDYCINEGLFDTFSEGIHHLGELMAESWIETGIDESQITVHPAVHAMALWVACECGKSESKWLVHARRKLKGPPRNWAESHRVSLMRNKIAALPQIPECKMLTTLMLQGNAHLKAIPDDFFPSTPKLKVLDLSQTSLEQIPAGIACLKELQYFDVSDTKIKSLPKEVGKLVELKFFMLSRTLVETIPEGVIKKLIHLEVFFVDFSYGGWKAGSDGAGVSVGELENLHYLKALGISVESSGALRKLTASDALTEAIESLHIRGCPGLESISNKSLGENLEHVKTLQLKNANDLEELTIDRDEWYLRSVTDLILQRLPGIIKITWSQGYCFEDLMKLTVSGCEGMETLIHKKDGGGSEQGRTSNNQMNSRSARREISPFPRLKSLELIHLPKLNSIFEGGNLNLPSLESLRVTDCPNLKKLAINANKLVEISGGQDWWDHIEWDGESSSNRPSLFKLLPE